METLYERKGVWKHRIGTQEPLNTSYEYEYEPIS